MEIQEEGKIASNVDAYSAKNGLIRFHIGNKGEDGQFGQFFSLNVPNSLSYEEALEQFRSVPELEAPETDTPISVSIMGSMGILRWCYPLDVDFSQIVADMQIYEQGAIQTSERFCKSFRPEFPRLGEKGIKYRIGIFLPEKYIEVCGASELYDTPPDFHLESGEKKIPAYLAGLMQNFRPGISEQESASVFKEFETKLAY